MTSNIGAGNLQNSPIGWQKENEIQGVVDHFIDSARKHFRPELFNRIDQIIPFKPLTQEVVRLVVEREIKLLKNKEGVKFRKMDLVLKKGVMDFLAEKGYDTKYGARNLQRFIREQLTIPLAKRLNLIDFDDQLIVEVLVADNKLDIKIDADPLGLELLFEELDKINYADHASELRRSILQLQEGPYFIKLLSEIDIIERTKKRLGDTFWIDKARAKEYTEKLQFLVKIKALMQRIEEYENELSLACLGLKAYNPGIIELLKKWKHELFAFKIELLAHENEDLNQCHFSIYGSKANILLEQYLSIFKAKGYEFNTETIWFKDQTVKSGKKKVENYIKKKWNTKDVFVDPAKDGSSLYGIEIELKGPCVLLFLQDEIGLHHWKMSSNEDYVFVVEIEAQKSDTPKKINRKEFYKGSPRRVYKNGHFKDNRLKISREVSKNQFDELILKILDDRFKERLNSELL